MWGFGVTAGQNLVDVGVVWMSSPCSFIGKMNLEKDARMYCGLLNLDWKRDERWRRLCEHHGLRKLIGWLNGQE